MNFGSGLQKVSQMIRIELSKTIANFKLADTLRGNSSFDDGLQSFDHKIATQASFHMGGSREALHQKNQHQANKSKIMPEASIAQGSQEFIMVLQV